MTKLVLLNLCMSLLILPAWGQQSLTLTLETPRLSSHTYSNGAGTDARKPSVETSRSMSSASRTSNATRQVIGRVGKVTTRSASIRVSRSNGSRALARIGEGTPLGIVKQVGEWYGVLMIDGSTGWIPRAVVAMLDYDLVIAGQQAQTAGQRIVQAATKYVGVPYTWGGYSWGGLDCSGFVKAVYANFGINLPRCSRDQARVGQSISYDQLQPGDRLYFACKGGDIDHTGIYAGNGYFIHSASSRGGVTFDTLNRSKFGRALVVARR